MPARAVALRGRDGGATAELGDDLQNCLRASGGGGDKPHVLAPVALHPTQDPISNNDGTTHCLGTGSKGGQATVAVAHTLRGEGFDASEDGTGRGTPLVPVGPMAVRRLTPRECERLQGFPDDYTRIPWRKKPAEACPDGPRYKALGNSWAVPNVRWIGARIALALAILEAANSNRPASKRGVA